MLDFLFHNLQYRSLESLGLGGNSLGACHERVSKLTVFETGGIDFDVKQRTTDCGTGGKRTDTCIAHRRGIAPVSYTHLTLPTTF